MKKSYTAGFKSKVAIEAIKGEKTLAELASIYQVHVSQIRQWKSKAMEALPRVFESKKEKRQKEQEIGIDDVYNGSYAFLNFITGKRKQSATDENQCEKSDCSAGK